MNTQDKQKMAKAIAELVHQNPAVRQAIWECACSCPNLVVEY